MECLLLNTNFETVGIVDNYDSLIWTDRYNEYGDFEIYVGASNSAFSLYKHDYYVYNRDSEHLMIVEDIGTDTDVEDGAFTTITGRSLESILERRILRDYYAKNNWKVQDAIKLMMDGNILVPGDANRKVANLTMTMSTNPAVLAPVFDFQYSIGENLYTVIRDICQRFNLGFKITMPTNKQFVFELYAGKDRSYDQVANSQVTFSPNFDNLGESNYLHTKRNFKSVILLGGATVEGTNNKRFTNAVAPSGSGVGLNYREMYADVTDIKIKPDGTNAISESAYLAQLAQRGTEILAQNTESSTFDGKINNLETFKFRRDYDMGDILQIENEYGFTSKSRVVEYIRSQSGEGIDSYPTLKSV